MRIKKAFLKSLYENILNQQETHCVKILMADVPKYLNRKLTKEEFKASKELLNELVRDGYIKGSQKVGKYILTNKGAEIVKLDFDTIKLPRIDLSILLSSRYDLLKRVYSSYLNGDYETAIFKAFKLLEEKVRTKAGLPISDRVQDIMSDAFKLKGGRLMHPNAITNGEKDGLHFLVRGAIMFFKSPRSHRTVIEEDPNKIIEILLFAKYLLDLVDQCVKVNGDQKKT